MREVMLPGSLDELWGCEVEFRDNRFGVVSG